MDVNACVDKERIKNFVDWFMTSYLPFLSHTEVVMLTAVNIYKLRMIF